MHCSLTVVNLWLRVAAVEKAEAEKVQVVKAAEADAEVCTDSSLHALHHRGLKGQLMLCPASAGTWCKFSGS